MEEASEIDPRKYVKLAAVLRAEIASGGYAVGDRLPALAVIADEHALSRATVAKALHLLCDEGILAAIPGMGFYVRARQ